MKLEKLSLFIAILTLSACSTNKANQWLKQQESAKALKQKVYIDVNLPELKKQYSANKEIWDKAFYFMQNNDLEKLAVGKYPIDGESIFASVTNIIDKPFEQTNWESHRKYIDLQYIIKGKEKILEADFAGQKVKSPYNAAKDVANYNIEGGNAYIADSKTFYLFFPSKAHRPNIAVNQDSVKKLVIKIRVAE